MALSAITCDRSTGVIEQLSHPPCHTCCVHRTRRVWKPNVQNKKFFSEAYQRFLSFRMTTSAIKKVKKLAGGIDEYLKTTPSSVLLYSKAITIKKNLKRLDLVRERNAAIAAMETAALKTGES